MYATTQPPPRGATTLSHAGGMKLPVLICNALCADRRSAKSVRLPVGSLTTSWQRDVASSLDEPSSVPFAPSQSPHAAVHS